MADAAMSDASNSQFYRALDPTKDLIRILDLLPGAYHSDIKGVLRVVRLADLPRYCALSYTWGTTTRNRHIQVQVDQGAHNVAVTDNCFDALRNLRWRFRTRSLWIDALCINQSDNAEKGEQVAKMDRIYKTAERVDVWLGEHGHVSFLDGVRRLMKYLFGTPECIAVGPVSFGVHHIHRTMRHAIFGPQPEGDDHRDQSFLRSLLTRVQIWNDVVRSRPQKLELALKRTKPAWTSRVWVVQEFACAKAVTFGFGRESVSYDSLLRYDQAWEFWSACSPPDILEVEKFVAVLREYQLFKRSLQNQSTALDFYSAWKATYKTRATDLRDKLYGLLGLVPDNPLLKPNYDLPVAAVYTLGTLATIVQTDNLDVLELAGPFVEPRPEIAYEHGATWVADFASWDNFDINGQGFFPSSLLALPKACNRADGGLSIMPDLSRSALRILGFSLADVQASIAVFDTNKTSQGPELAIVVPQLVTMTNTAMQKLSERTELVHQGDIPPIYVCNAEREDLRTEDLNDPFVMNMFGNEGVRAPIKQCFLHFDHNTALVNKSEASWTLSDDTPVPLEVYEVMFSGSLADGREIEESYNVDDAVREDTDGVHTRDKKPKNQAKYQFGRDLEAYTRYALARSRGMSFFTTTNGMIGLGLGQMHEGDFSLLLVDGARLPIMLRRIDGREEYLFWGFAYIHGIMHGEVQRAWMDLDVLEREFVIV